jgi:hypothetical protein
MLDRSQANCGIRSVIQRMCDKKGDKRMAVEKGSQNDVAGSTNNATEYWKGVNYPDRPQNWLMWKKIYSTACLRCTPSLCA